MRSNSLVLLAAAAAADAADDVLWLLFGTDELLAVLLADNDDVVDDDDILLLFCAFICVVEPFRVAGTKLAPNTNTIGLQDGRDDTGWSKNISFSNFFVTTS